jgi:hypothetical protein
VRVAPGAEGTGIDNEDGVAAATANQHADAAPCPHPCATCCQAPPTDDRQNNGHARADSLPCCIAHFRSLSRKQLPTPPGDEHGGLFRFRFRSHYLIVRC